MPLRITTVLLGALAGLGMSLFALADPVIDWNNLVLDAVRRTHENPPRAARVLAMVHVAIFDAVNGIEGHREPYHVSRKAPPGALPEAAAATAAYELLRALYPKLNPVLKKQYRESAGQLPESPAKSRGQEYSTFSGASARLLARFFGSDAIAFCGESPDPRRWPALSGVKRCWDTLSQAAEEAGRSRIYGGIHWQFDNRAGLTAGRALADYVFENTLRDPRPAERIKK